MRKMGPVGQKWLINVFGVVFGTFWLGQWLDVRPPISQAEGIAALSNPIYLHARTMNLSGGAFQNLTVIFAVFISVLKPWKPVKQTSKP
jgi:hypothetical protein